MVTVIYLHSSGRSGSNRFLDLFDLHERTLCRNEPEEVDGDFARLSTVFTDDALPPDFTQRWRQTVQRARGRNSLRDRFDRTGKQFFRWPLARPGQVVMSKQRLRRAIGAGAGEEWDIPALWFRRAIIDQVIPVLKCLSQPHWALRLHHSCPDHVVIHNIRTPDRYLKSWWNRYVCDPVHGGAERVYQNTRSFLPKVLAHFGINDASRYDHMTGQTLLESELWLWRYSNELPFARLSGRPRYAMFWYEDISKDRLGQCRAAYAAAGLDFTEAHARRLAGMRNTLFASPHSEALDASLVEAAMTHVLADSPLWPDICARRV